MSKAAALCSVFLALGFGLPGLFGAAHLARTGEVWTFMGFPTYGGGPFERVGLPSSVALVVAFVVVCALELVVGVLLWVDAPHAALFSLLLLPVETVFWIGFALPLGPPIGIARVVLAFLA